LTPFLGFHYDDGEKKKKNEKLEMKEVIIRDTLGIDMHK
jgi:hypothetical protein